jgi:hypothetical protein
MNPPHPVLQAVLLALQLFQVAFLWLHDWLPLGRLNDVAAIRLQDTLTRRLIVTLIQGIPWTLGLIGSLRHVGQRYPHALILYLWISYGILFYGELRAWWIPYLVHPDPVRAQRYQLLFGNTHSLLPARNGLVPNTLHTLLHLATAATLLTLAAV